MKKRFISKTISHAVEDVIIQKCDSYSFYKNGIFEYFLTVENSIIRYLHGMAYIGTHDFELRAELPFGLPENDRDVYNAVCIFFAKVSADDLKKVGNFEIIDRKIIYRSYFNFNGIEHSYPVRVVEDAFDEMVDSVKYSLPGLVALVFDGITPSEAVRKCIYAKRQRAYSYLFKTNEIPTSDDLISSSLNSIVAESLNKDFEKTLERWRSSDAGKKISAMFDSEFSDRSDTDEEDDSGTDPPSEGNRYGVIRGHRIKKYILCLLSIVMVFFGIRFFYFAPETTFVSTVDADNVSSESYQILSMNGGKIQEGCGNVYNSDADGILRRSHEFAYPNEKRLPC